MDLQRKNQGTLFADEAVSADPVVAAAPRKTPGKPRLVKPPLIAREGTCLPSMLSEQLRFKEAAAQLPDDGRCARERIKAAIAAGILQKILVVEDPLSKKKSVRYLVQARTMRLF